jgi:hypothetical protein
MSVEENRRTPQPVLLLDTYCPGYDLAYDQSKRYGRSQGVYVP